MFTKCFTKRTIRMCVSCYVWFYVSVVDLLWLKQHQIIGNKKLVAHITFLAPASGRPHA